MIFVNQQIEKGISVQAELPIRNINRAVGTIIGSEITRKWGATGLSDDTISIKFRGSAGQSFGAFTTKGMTLRLEGDANDYVGKGLSGGRLIIYPPIDSNFKPSRNVIIGNVALYGATSGELYVSGMAGERFGVRNSGAIGVVEAVGSHCLEYMTGGIIVVLGPTGRNCAAGMSGGIGYIFDEEGTLPRNLNTTMVDLENIETDTEAKELYHLIENHAKFTNSTVAHSILSNWKDKLVKFTKIIPKDYKQVLKKIEEAKLNGLTGEEAVLAAFNSIHH